MIQCLNTHTFHLGSCVQRLAAGTSRICGASLVLGSLVRPDTHDYSLNTRDFIQSRVIDHSCRHQTCNHLVLLNHVGKLLRRRRGCVQVGDKDLLGLGERRVFLLELVEFCEFDEFRIGMSPGDLPTRRVTEWFARVLLFCSPKWNAAGIAVPTCWTRPTSSPSFSARAANSSCMSERIFCECLVDASASCKTSSASLSCTSVCDCEFVCVCV